MNKQKIKTALKYGSTIALAGVAGATIVFLALRDNEKDDWTTGEVTPDDLQKLIDNPNGRIVFDETKWIIESTDKTAA